MDIGTISTNIPQPIALSNYFLYKFKMLLKTEPKPLGGRPPLIKLYPAKLFMRNYEEEVLFLRELYGMTTDKARECIRLGKMGRVYITQHAKAKCQYHVIVNTGKDVPQQGEFGVPVVQIAIRRMDGKPDPVYWSDMQGIKRALLGDNVEAMEIFPAMDRRLIGDNEFRYLWAFPNGERIPVGWDKQDQIDPQENVDGKTTDEATA